MLVMCLCVHRDGVCNACIYLTKHFKVRTNSMATFYLVFITLTTACFPRSTSLLVLQSLSQVQWRMGPPLQMGRCEHSVSENNELIRNAFAATTTLVVVKWNGT